MSYIPVPATPKYIEGTTATDQTTPQPLPYTSVHADTDLAATPATTSWTILKTGYYSIAAWLKADVLSNTDVSLEIVVNGGSVDSRTSGVNAGATAALGCGVLWQGLITAGQTVVINGEKGVGGSTTTGEVQIVFIPTEAYPS